MHLTTGPDMDSVTPRPGLAKKRLLVPPISETYASFFRLLLCFDGPAVPFASGNFGAYTECKKK